jgi:hypothetical protein
VSAVAGEVAKGGVFETLPAEAATRIARRDFSLAEEIARVERAALDWGLHADALEGRFVSALLRAIEETGKTNLATLGDLEALLEKARREGEADRRRIERMIEAGSNALAMAHQAAGLASVRAEEAIGEAIERIAKEMSKATRTSPPASRPIVFPSERNRREAWRLAAWVAAGAVAVFIGGIATAHWWNAKESAARQAMLEALDRCWVQPVMVRTADGKTVEMCRLADLTTDRPN